VSRKTEDFNDSKNISEEAPDTYYNEELSRAAVGRLFDDDDDDGPPPIKSAFVTGFDRSPTRDRSHTRRRERPAAREVAPVEEPPEAAHEHHDEPAVERPRRRGTATTRLLNDSPDDNADADRRERVRRRNPSPRPAVRVNVPSERQVDDHQDHIEYDDSNPSDGDLDSFRRRYNSGELFSPPRNPNRPVRPGGDVRTNRVRPSDRDMDTVSPMRMILAGAAILVLVLISILTIQLISVNNRLGEAVEAKEAAEAALLNSQREADIQSDLATETLRTVEDENRELRAILRENGLDPDAPPPPPDDGTGPGAGDDPPQAQQTPATPTLPTVHTVAAGENLNRIAQRYFGNTREATINHIAATNNISNPERIQIGQPLQITPMN
jgi:LysM repeat protein